MGDVKKNPLSRQRITHILLAVAFVAVGLMGYIDQKMMSVVDEVAMVGDKKEARTASDMSMNVPDAEFSRLDGEKVRLDAYAGKTIVLHFWATWCVPCVKEFPELLNMAEKAGDDVLLVAVSNDRDKAQVAKFLQKVDKAQRANLANVKMLIDPTREVSQEVFQSYKLPETIIINPSFQMVKKIVGAETKWSDEAMLSYLNGL